MFNADLIGAQIYQDWPLHYDPLLPQTVTEEDGTVRTLDTGVRILENGDVVFTIYAPAVKQVQVTSKAFNFELTKQDDGTFTGTLPWDPIKAGPHSFDYILDGACFLDPYAPISWHRNRPVNYVDIPDPETPYIHVQDVPHGSVTREIYWSQAMNRYERCIVYTPPGYMKGTDSYPVLYLQHGMTENEVTWEFNGRVSSIMDNGIAAGEIVPFIIVMNNGMIRYKSGERVFTDKAFGDNLLGSCIPYIEEHYRVKTGPENRAMAGLSMGSTQTSLIGLTHPELFSAVGLFSGFMRALYDDSPESLAHLAGLKDPEQFAKDFKVFFRAVGDRDNLKERFAMDDTLCARYGIDKLPNYHRYIYANQFHEFGAWRRALHDFAPLLFRW